MTTINYEINGVVVEIEVDDAFANVYIEEEKAEKRSEDRLKWHKRKNLTDLDSIEERGGQIADPRTDFIDSFAQEDEMERALAILTKEQRELIRKVYYEGYSLTEIAREKNCSKVAVTQQKQRALAQLKKYFKKL